MKTRVVFAALLVSVSLGVSVALYAVGRQAQHGVIAEPQVKVPPTKKSPQPEQLMTLHDVPETVDNAPIRIYRIGHNGPGNPTMFPGSSGKRWQLTDTTEQSLAITTVGVWAGHGNYGSLPFLGSIPAGPGDSIQLDFTNAGMDHHVVTIRQDEFVAGATREPLWLQNDDFAFEQQSGAAHHLKLDAANDAKYTLNSVRVNNATICVRTGAGNTVPATCGYTNDNGWKVQIKICSVAFLCLPAPQQ